MIATPRYADNSGYEDDTLSTGDTRPENKRNRSAGFATGNSQVLYRHPGCRDKPLLSETGLSSA
jgi:hypothetical protein